MYKHIAASLAFAAATSALPTANGPSCQSIAITEPFGLQMILNGFNTTLAPSTNGTNDSVVLVAASVQAPIAYGVEPCSGGAYLMVNVSDTDYSLTVPNIGLVDGVADTLYAGLQQYDSDFTIPSQNGEFITHTLTHADEGFLACEAIVDGVQSYVLSWGSENLNGTYKEGCQFTTLKRVQAFASHL